MTSAGFGGAWPELLGLFLVACGAVVPLLRGGAVARVLAAGAIALVGLGLLARPQPVDAVTPQLPRQVERAGYVSSDSCRSCHSQQWQTWYDSYHRTMTQPASAATALGDFDDVTLEHLGRTWHLQRRGDELWVSMPDPDWEQGMLQRGVEMTQLSAPRVERQIVMFTGSHHQQGYWVRLAMGRAMWQLPFVWLIEAERWIPVDYAFLQTPGFTRNGSVWNLSCFLCHSVATVPDPASTALRRTPMDSVTAELGIACEACHGPAGAHAAANHDPVRRYQQIAADGGDPTIVNPQRLERRRASQVCGQCHTVVEPHRPEQVFTQGLGFQPGQDLAELLHLDTKIDELGTFWGDGTCRVGGREYHGMTASTCYDKGDISCLDCHQMHGSDPDDQLYPEMRGDQACASCHQLEIYATPEHTHHAPGSSGSECMNCHMPHTSYALFKAIRRHSIDSPSVMETLEWGRPNACNLCHLDRSLAWTGEHLTAWYGPSPASSADLAELDQDDRDVASAVRLMTSGDAAQRALVAWHMGWAPAVAASSRDGGAWLAPHLSRLLTDEYAVVRYIAGRSLQRLPGYGSLGYDYIAPPGDRERVQQAAFDRWQAGPKSQPAGDPAAVLVDRDGTILEAALRRLLEGRQESNIYIAE